MNKKFTPALGFDFLTAWYDLAIKLTMPEKKIRHVLLTLIDSQSTEKVLEFGFGTAQNIILLKKKHPNLALSGLDIDPKVQKIAAYKLAKNNINCNLDLYTGAIFPYADEEFDKIYSCLVFHQLSADSKINSLKEIYRVLKPNGKIIIADWGKAQNKIMRFTFCLVQLLDGFANTNDNRVYAE